MKSKYIIIIVALIIAFALLFIYSQRDKEEVFLIGDSGNWSFSAINNSNRSCSEFNFTGVLFNMDELLDMTKEQRAGFTYGYVSGFMWEYDTNKTTPLLSIIIECDNQKFEKQYWNISDFSGEDDCFKENMCWIKYESSEKSASASSKIPNGK